MDYYKKDIDTVFSELSTSIEGLSTEQVSVRIKEHGHNELDKAPGDSVLKKFFSQLCDPMIIMLLFAAAVSAVIGFAQNEGFADVIIILAVVVINAVLGVYQESKAESALDDLQKMAASNVTVVRDGHMCQIDARDLVIGDIVVLEPGDIVPADGRLIETANLKIEEAALTGESTSVSKSINLLEMTTGESRDVSLADRKNMAYSGTTVVYGRGKMVVCATGMNTEIGKIAGALSKASNQATPLQIKMAQLSKILTWVVIGICIVVFGVQLLRAGGFSFKFAIDAFMIAVTLAVAAIPEGLPAIVTVVLSIGVTNMSKRNAIIRKLTAVETLGCAQVICSDKTGTLTQNQMTVVNSFENGVESDRNVIGSLALMQGMALCCDATVDSGDPTEVALVQWADNQGLELNNLQKCFPRVGEAPFDSVRKLMSTIHSISNREKLSVDCSSTSKYVQYTKGAIDVVLSRCSSYLDNGKVVPLDDDSRTFIMKQNKLFADKALRVLACAYRLYDDKPVSYEASKLEQDLIFIGFTGMIDPVRPEVKAAIEKCKIAGIRPIMITGDHADTARAIAQELNIVTDDTSVMTGSELQNLSDEDFEHMFDKISVYARVQPEHKTRIVKAWQKAGYVVAMTGDGVNDAPSIKTADIGVGMGITGTDVTKNVADMVLTDDNFASIVNAVEEGRTIYDNILKAIQFLLSSNFSEVFSVFFATLAGFVILKPVHLLWINLVTDTFPALALGFEKSEPNIMERCPRDPKASIFANGRGFDICYQGATVTVLCIVSYFVGMYIETGYIAFMDSPHGTTMAFLTMAMVAIFHSFNMRSLRGSIFKLNSQNVFLWLAAVLSLILTTVVAEVPFLATIFQFSSVGLLEYSIAIGLGFCVIPIVEVVKLAQRIICSKN